MFQRTLNVIGWGPHLRRLGTYIQSLRTTWHSGRNGLSASAWALSWSTLVHKTQHQPNQKE
jgi:hypothetical protein